jgi:CRP-like cAMP-binding protein
VSEVRAAVAAHPFARGLDDAAVDALAAEARLVRAAPGTVLAPTGAPVDRWWLVRSGRVGLEVRDAPPARRRVETVEPGEALGWSWLVGPTPWHVDVVAASDAELIELDGRALAARCDHDPALGLALARRLLTQAGRRLERVRLQLVDLYGAS